MNFGLTIEKLVLIGVIAAVLVGPERLPRYAEALARLTVRAREWMAGAKTRVKEEMGDDFDDVDWRTLDPRRYDPRRIIREALLDDAPVPTVKAASATSAMASAGAAAGLVTPDTAAGDSAEPGDGDSAADDTEPTTPFDSEAT